MLRIDDIQPEGVYVCYANAILLCGAEQRYYSALRNSDINERCSLAICSALPSVKEGAYMLGFARFGEPLYKQKEHTRKTKMI